MPDSDNVVLVAYRGMDGLPVADVFKMFANWPSDCCHDASSSFDLDPRAVDYITANRYVQRKRQNDAIVDDLEGGVYPVILSCLSLLFKDISVRLEGVFFFLYISYHHKAFSSR